MKLLYDASSIINLCAERRIEKLIEGWTLSLTFYEVGNAIWKQIHLHKTLAPEEGVRALDALVEVLKKVREIRVEETSAILNIAVEEGLRYYDASYIHAAIKKDMALITDEKKLYSIAEKYVETITSGDLD